MSGLTKKIYCILFILVGGLIGYEIIPGIKIINIIELFANRKWLLLTMSFFVGSFFGFIIFILSHKKLSLLGKSFISYLLKIPAQNILSGVIGLIVGLIIANLLAYSLSFIPFIGNYLPIILLNFKDQASRPSFNNHSTTSILNFSQ